MWVAVVPACAVIVGSPLSEGAWGPRAVGPVAHLAQSLFSMSVCWFCLFFKCAQIQGKENKQ